MKRFIKLFFLFLFAIFLFTFNKLKVKAYADSTTNLPIGENYLDPSNFLVNGTHPSYSVTTFNQFLIKPATMYSLFSTNGIDDYINNFSCTFYDEFNNIINITPIYTNRYYDTKINGYTFETPASAKYITLQFNIERSGQNEEFNPDAIDNYFVFCEGTTYPDVEGTLIPYLGPNVSLEPVISGQTGYYYTYVDNPITVAEIKAGLVATDDVDGDITANIQVYQDNYTANSNVVGEHSIIFRVSDSSGNTTDLTIYVVVIDNIAPVISGNTNYTTSYTTLLTNEYIISQLTVTDNHDTNLLIQVSEDNYASFYQTVGTYSITYITADNSNNSSTYTVFVEVIDDLYPSITGPEKITKSNNIDMPLTELLKQYQAYDDYDKDITSRIEVTSDNYSYNPNTVGNWTINLSVSDNFGNVTTKLLTVEVLDKTPPIFLIDKTKITIELKNNTVQVSDMIGVLKRTNAISVESEVQVVLDEYTINKNTPGTYKVILESNDNQIELIVEVVNQFVEDDSNKEIHKLNFFEKILAFLKKLLYSIINFFKNLF